jgi:tRNA-specific 2-thiouridylase
LQLPFITLDASKEYKEGVIDYLLREYRAGRTPNPDIMCNREVKFGVLYEYARAHGADFLATGHYARNRLLRGVDADKDQSYFLWAVPKQVLEHTLFPLGELKKADTRILAKQFKLPVATKRDSQGICFLGNISIEEFLQHEFAGDTAAQPGEAVDSEGASVGQHSGALFHTLGERIALQNAAAGPWYVVRKDIITNTVVVSHARELSTPGRSTAIQLSQTNWIQAPEEGKAYTAQYRYHGPRITGTLDSTNTHFNPTETLPEPCAIGQSLVLYDGEQCIGGGIIEGA